MRVSLDIAQLYRYDASMAYLRKLRQGKRTYFYIMRSERKGGKVSGKVLEYLGRDPDPVKLKRACEYWGVGPRSNGRRKTR